VQQKDTASFYQVNGSLRIVVVWAFACLANVSELFWYGSKGEMVR